MDNQGNAAAMRAALNDVLLALDEAGFKPLVAGDPLAVAVLKAGQALAAQPRNCDRFRTADEVSAYWGANVHAVPLHGDAYAMRIDGREFATFLDWLLAPAEGGVE